MDPHDQPGPDLSGGDAAPPDDDQLTPVRDLLDAAPDVLVPEPVVPVSDVADVQGDVGALAPIIEDLAPPAPDPDRPGAIDEPGHAPPDQPPGPRDEPISLDLDPGAAGPPQEAPPTPPPAPDGVDLSLDTAPDLGAPTEPAAEELRPATEGPDPEEPAEVALPMADLTPVEVPLAEGNGSISPGLVAAAVAVVGASAHALRRLRRPTAPDLAAHLDALGIDARVEHLDLVGLEELLARGTTVLLSTDGSAGVDASSVLQLRSVDHRRGELDVVDDAGARRTVALAPFEEAWADSAHQVVEARGPDGDVALVPVVLHAEDLQVRR